MTDKGFSSLNDKGSNFNPMRSFIWTIDFDSDVNSRVHTDLFSDGFHTDMMSQKISLPTKTLNYIKVMIMGGEREFPAKFSFEHGCSIEFIEDEQTNIKARFEKWLNAFHPMQEKLDGTGQSFMSKGDKFDGNGNLDLATNFVVTLYKYGSADTIEGEAILQYKLNAVFPVSVSEPELNRNDMESVVITKVDFRVDYATLIFTNLDKKLSDEIIGYNS